MSSAGGRPAASHGTSGCGVGWSTGLSGSGGCSGNDDGTLAGADGPGVSGGIGMVGTGSVGGGLG
ncbi:hypothetical protein ILT44_03325 [Microvirga sp. BT689]|uniref:hypothetical protein n=1 Tax=Microvirga arvi TaxID=2778731 RepID=UPI00195103BC|nr:hypothetical protein [Microvirga arvi]MBM6579204.1 hypothetical protein [Microvirga arvi]